MQIFSLKMSDGKELKGRVWQAANEQAILQIVHGASEHSLRYEDFALWLAEQGITVYILDNRGHGLNQMQRESLVRLADDASERMPLDILELGERIRHKHAGVPMFLLGHSMGSFIARIAASMPNPYEKYIFVGTAYEPDALLAFGSRVARTLRRVKGRNATSKMLDNLTFNGLKKSMKKKGIIQEDMEWLSSDPDATLKNHQDSKLQQRFTVNAFVALFELMQYAQDKEVLEHTKKPVLFLSGKHDPTGDYTKAVKALAKRYREYTEAPINEHYYANMRHEVLNEKNKLQVYQDIEEFICH